ncbi:hypothetical protein J4Q44_G00009540 [Coregonus suidteri]|uniref:FHA domain-containing protein n=1 Tax=Coregonus suidteri TaxID=861788 RepID=A0AAN8MKQ3_9TELE
MPLHGKIVVIKRSGGDGTEFPLTASCLFGRKPDCDIRIQLPQVSKEHCRIELNENKEVILTNLSSVNPTRVNGEVFQQSECLKHGDLITIIDRSFRFEYPPAPTPKKNRYSTASKSETPQVLHETQARDTSAKDGTNTSDVKPKEDGSLEQNKPSSPFCELYQMFKQDLDSKTPKKAPGTPASRLCPQNPISTKKVDGASVISTPKKAETENVSPITGVTPKSAQKKRKSLKGLVVEGNVPVEDFIQLPQSIQDTPKGKRRSSKSKTPTTVEEKSTPVSQRKSRPATPEKFTACEVVEHISECPTAETHKTPTRRRSKEATPIKSLVTGVEPPADAVISNQDQTVLTENSTPSTPKTEFSRSPRSAGKKLQAHDVLCELEATTPTNVKQSSAKKRKSGELETEFPTPLCKRKRVSFGGHLEPELFDKRLPPDSPLCKGATPGRRSLCVPKTKQSLLRRASAIGLIKEHEQSAPESLKVKGSPGKNASPKTPSPAKKSPKATPKTPSPAKKSPKATPKTPSPAKKTPKATPKTPSPAKKTPKATPKTPSPAKKSPKATPKTPSPAKKTPKAKTPSPGKEKTPKTAVKTPSPARRKSPLKDGSQTPKAGKTQKTPASLPSANTTPTVQGRFSVSLISTPSPTTDQDSVLQTSVTVTPRVPLRRTSMKSTSKTIQNSAITNALQVIRRRSGVSRASMKVVNSWADIVKFGQTKAQAVIPTKRTSSRVTKTKTVVPKPKTPTRKLIGHVSTGHADSPVTIVVGKAHRLKAIQPSGAAPKLVHNIALLRNNMRMDEDLSGVADMFKTPARQSKSVVNVQSALKTPQRSQSTSMIDSSLMNTPEETSEMVVSPLFVSTAQRGAYNSDAVTRLLRDDQESSFITANATEEADSHTAQNEIPALEMSSEESKEEQQPESEKMILTPKQKKPEQPECLTGVKRIMKTPRQKVQPIEDLRGKLLKTPKQKLEQPECLTGVKRIMKTPRQKVQPIEDLRGKLMTTPRGPKAAQEVSLDGMKELLMTPKQIAEPVEEISGKAQDDDNVHSETKEIQGDSISPKCLSGNVEFKMPLYGKIFVIKRSGGDGTEFPLTASCLFGRKPDCDICIKLPQVSKEHCRIELNENNEVILTNLSSANPTRVNGEVLQQSERLKHGDLITIIDRSFRFEYPPAPTPKKNIYSKQNTPRGPKAAQKVSLDGVKTPKHIAQPVEEISVKGRRGKKTEGIVPPPARPSARGRAARRNETSSVEAPAETMDSVDVPEKMAADPGPAEKPKRGRKAKQASVEKVETVQENAVESESAEIPPIEDQQPTSDVPVEKPRRGRKAKQASVKQVETVPENTVEAMNVPVTEKVEAQTPVFRSKRGRKLDSVEKVEAEVLEIPPIEIVEAKEMPASVAVEKPRARGRRAKQESEEAKTMEENVAEVVAVDIPPTETVEALVPVAKPKRGRKTKQESVEQVESVSGETPFEQVEAQEQATVAPVEKPKRGGRKTKQASVEQVEDHPVESLTVEVQEQTNVALVEKPKRGGRRTKQDPECVVPPVSTETQEETSAPPTEKPKRGGRRTKQASVEDHPVESLTVEAQEQTTVAPVEKPKRGGRTKQDPESVIPPVSTETQEETSAPPTEKPKRGGRRAKQQKVPEVVEVENMVVKEVHLSAQTEEVDAKPEREETVAEAEELLEARVVKPGWGRKARAVVKDEVPAKRARRGAADSTKVTTAAEATVEVPNEPVKRARRAAKSKVSADETTIAAESTPLESEVTDTEVMTVVVKKGRGKAPKKGNVSETTSDKANYIEGMETIDEDSKNTSTSVNWKPDLEVTHKVTPLPKQKKSRRNDTVPVTEVEEQPERIEEQQVVKAVRGRRARTNVEVKEETVQSTPSKRARHCAPETAAAEATVPISKPVNKRNMKTEEPDLSDKAVPKEPVKKTRGAAKSTDAATIEATSTAPAVPGEVPETVSEATVVTATKGRGKAPKKGKAVSQEIDIEQATESEQPSKPRRGRAARK